MVSRLLRNSGLPQVQRSRVTDPLVQRAFDGVFEALSGAVNFLQAFAQPDPWHLVEFIAGWATFSDQLQYRKDPLGYVHLQGNAARSSGSSSTLFVLPQGYRPSQRLYFGLSTLSGASYVASRVDVDTDGRVLVASGGTDFVMLDGITFYAGV